MIEEQAPESLRPPTYVDQLKSLPLVVMSGETGETSTLAVQKERYTLLHISNIDNGKLTLH